MTVTDDSHSHALDGVDRDDPQNQRCILPRREHMCKGLIDDFTALGEMGSDEIARYCGQQHPRRP